MRKAVNPLELQVLVLVSGISETGVAVALGHDGTLAPPVRPRTGVQSVPPSDAAAAAPQGKHRIMPRPA